MSMRFIVIMIMILVYGLEARCEVLGSLAATIVTVEGRVMVGNKAVLPGDTLRSGQTIQTGERSGVKLLFADHSLVDVGPSTEYKIESVNTHPPSVSTQLNRGKVRALIEKRVAPR